MKELRKIALSPTVYIHTIGVEVRRTDEMQLGWCIDGTDCCPANYIQTNPQAGYIQTSGTLKLEITMFEIPGR